MDGVYLGQSPALNYHLFDIERVEVLRGPQGPLFGKDTVAGAVHLVSKKPLEKFESKVDLELGDYDYLLTRAILNTPMGKDKCYARLSVSHTERDGFYTNVVNGKKLDGGHTNTFRAQIRNDISDSAEFTASFDGIFSEKDVVLGDALTDTFAMGTNTESPGKYDVSYNIMPDEKNDQYGISGILDVGIGDNATLTGISAYRHTKIQSKIDLDYSSNDFGTAQIDDRYRQYSQEIRLHSELETRLDYILGLYYVRQNARTRRKIIVGKDIFRLGDPRLLPGNDIPNSVSAIPKTEPPLAV